MAGKMIGQSRSMVVLHSGNSPTSWSPGTKGRRTPGNGSKPFPLSAHAKNIMSGFLSLDDDIAPSLVRHLNNMAGLAARGGTMTKPEPPALEEDLQPPSDEVQSWIATTLASLPANKRMPTKGSRLPSRRSSIDHMDSDEEEEGAIDIARKLSKQINFRALAEGYTGSGPDGTLPDAKEALKLLKAGGTIFTGSQLIRFNSTFDRFKASGAPDCPKEVLPDILRTLGFSFVVKEEVKAITDEVTVYSTIDNNEFVTCLDKYAVHEKTKFAAAFEKDPDVNDGLLETAQLQRFLFHLGIGPSRHFIKESLEMCAESAATLDFEAVYRVIALFRNSEGFAQSEILDIHGVFMPGVTKFGPNKGKMPVAGITGLLVNSFGPAVTALAKRMGKEAKAGPLCNPDELADEEDGSSQPPLPFSEVLIFARRMREREFLMYEQFFDKKDPDDGTGQRGGTFLLSNLAKTMKTLGFTVTQKTLDELIEEFVSDVGGTRAEDVLEFFEFTNLLAVFREKEGFSNSELDELISTFCRFDEDGSGELDVLELSDMMHYMGYSTKLEDIQRWIPMCDFNGNGQLDQREYLRLARLHREEILAQTRQVFMKHNGGNDDVGIAPAGLEIALAELGFVSEKTEEDRDDELHQALKLAQRGGNLHSKGSARRGQSKPRIDSIAEQTQDVEFVHFPEFVDIVDARRAHKTWMQRRHAGFSETEMGRIKRLFNQYDPSRIGLITPAAVAKFLKDLKIRFDSVNEDADKSTDKLSLEILAARKAAKSMGVTDAFDPDGNVNLWVITQLLRKHYKKDDKRVLDREERAQEQSRFTQGEVDGFREAFQGCVMREKVFEVEAQASSNRHSILDIGQGSSTALSIDGMRRMLTSMGLKLTAENRVALQKKSDELDTPGRIAFADFLLLMRWMLDCNFAGIDDANRDAAR